MLRIVLLLVAAACLGLVYQHHERLSLAVTLVATFIKFPHSNTNVISITPLDSTTMPTANDSLVPAIIHQVLLGDLEMRPKWEQARASCKELHPTWEMKLWRDEEANEFVHQYYPSLSSIYLNYPLEIQRSNVLRYLLLHHYGGVYLDLDMRCRRPLDFFRNEDFITPPANPTGVNNAFIVSSKGHPFWQHLIDNLPRYNVDWFTPYLTNMFATGCHFFSTMHRTYHDQAHLKILDSTHKLNGHVVTPLFEHLGASSWHKGDAKVILQLGLFVERVKRVPILGLVLSIASLLVFAVILISRRRRNNNLGYTKLAHWDVESNL